jgi:hypothetical protein
VLDKRVVSLHENIDSCEWTTDDSISILRHTDANKDFLCPVQSSPTILCVEVSTLFVCIKPSKWQILAETLAELFL